MSRLRAQVPYLPSVVAAYRGEGAGLEVPRGLGPANVAPSQPAGLGNGDPIRLPGFNYPPAGCTVIDQMGDADIAPGATATMFTITVPDGQRFRIAGIGFGADDETALRFLTWSVLYGADATSGYNTESAVIGSIPQLADVVMLAASSTIVNVVGTASAAAVSTYHYIVRLRGWFYNEVEAS